MRFRAEHGKGGRGGEVEEGKGRTRDRRRRRTIEQDLGFGFLVTARRRPTRTPQEEKREGAAGRSGRTVGFRVYSCGFV